MDDLKDIRREIDAIDDQLIPLLCRRMDCSLRVASYKAAPVSYTHLDVYKRQW